MKLAFKIIGAIVFVVVIAVAALLFTFDPNDWKPQIIEQVEQKTGRQFEIRGDLGWSLFPWIGIEIGEVSLGNAPGFSQAEFAKMERLDVKVKLLPLFRKNIEVDKIKCHGLTVSLEVNEQGNNNWSDLAGPASEPDAAAQSKTVEQQQASPASMLAALAINGIEFADANIRYRDAGTGMEASISNFNLDTGAIRINQPVPVSVSATVASNQPDLKAQIAFKSQLRFNEALNLFDINNLALTVSTHMPEISNQAIELRLGMEAHVDMKQQSAKLSAVTAGVFGVELNAEFNVENMLATPRIKGSVSTREFNARALAASLNVELPPMARDTSLSRVSLATLVDTDTQKIYLDDFIVKLDDSTLRGWVHILDAGQPGVRYSLAMDSIHVDDYLPPAAAAGVVPAQNDAEAQADVEIALPVDMLRKLDLDGRLELDSARVHDITISKILVVSKAEGGVINISPVSMNALNGDIDASVQVDVRKQQKFALTLNANKLEAGEVVDPMLQGLLGEQKLSLQGAVKLAANIKTSGDRLSALKKNATGSVQFDMNETSVQGVDIEHFVRGLVADYLTEKSIPLPDDFRGSYNPEQKTAFKRVHATANIANGVVTNNDLLLDSSRIMVTGKGSADIIKNTVDYRAMVDLNPPRVKTLVEKALDQPIDVHVHGPFAQPVIEPDTRQMRKAVTDVIKAEAKAKAQQKIDEEKEKLRREAEQKKREAQQKVEQKVEQKKEEAVDKAKDKLRDLFGR